MAFVAPAGAGSLLAAQTQRASLAALGERRALPCRPHVARHARRAVIRAAEPRQVSAEELEEHLRGSPGPLISVFSAKWCGPCQFLVPHLDELGKKLDGRVDILKVDTDEYADYATTIGVRGLPSLYFIQDGQLKQKREGALTADELEKLSEHLFFGGPEPVLTS